jgi:hypothetical protein
MRHEQSRRPSARKIGLARGFENELPLGFPFRLEQMKDVLHRKVSSAAVKEAIPSPYSAGSAEPRVSSLELFIDLVFVSTITQLTSLLAREPTVTGLLQTIRRSVR